MGLCVCVCVCGGGGIKKCLKKKYCAFFTIKGEEEEEGPPGDTIMRHPRCHQVAPQVGALA